MTAFSKKVYALAQKIPKGKVATYAQLAKHAGCPRAARAVGSLMRCNPDKKSIPCHRVVASNGALAGYAFGGISAKKKLLMKEGVKFDRGKVNLDISLWNK